MIRKWFCALCAMTFIALAASCVAPFGSVVIDKPDSFTHVYEARENIVLRAIARIIREKHLGTDMVIDEKQNRIDTDYVVSGDWRTKTHATVKRLNWKECEVTLSVITEKQTKTGWEMRRLLKKDQYDRFFNLIDLRVYEEMYKIQ